MKLLRNAEIRHTLIAYLFLSATAICAALLLDRRFTLPVAAFCAAFIGIWFDSTARRYRRIAALAADIDHLLHGNDNLLLDDYTEGELSIRQSEINKMTIRLQEQRQLLTNDNRYLADISHQIRTPLTSINLLVSFISEPNLTEERRCERLRELYAMLSHIDWLITILLKLSKLDAGTVKFKQESVDM